MNLTIYAFEDADGVEQGFTTQDYAEAKTYAAENDYLIIGHIYEWADSERLDDFRPKRRATAVNRR